MTPDQIKALKPGPELDRAVCETLLHEYVGFHEDGRRLWTRCISMC